MRAEVRIRGPVCAVAASLLAGCLTLDIGESRHAATGIASEDAVVLLSRRHHLSHQAEASFTECVGRALGRESDRITMVAEREFVDGLFPWFEPRVAPLSPDALPELLDRPGVAAALANSGVRYLVWIDGTTDKGGSEGGMQCILAPGLAGCFGFGWWEKTSSYEASIWDLRERASAGTVSADVEGTSIMPALIVPVPLIARTESTACHGLARQLRVFLVGDEAAG